MSPATPFCTPHYPIGHALAPAGTVDRGQPVFQLLAEVGGGKVGKGWVRGPHVRSVSPPGQGGFIPSLIWGSKARHSASRQPWAPLPTPGSPLPYSFPYSRYSGDARSVGHIWDLMPPPPNLHEDLWGGPGCSLLLQPEAPRLTCLLCIMASGRSSIPLAASPPPQWPVDSAPTATSMLFRARRT